MRRFNHVLLYYTKDLDQCYRQNRLCTLYPLRRTHMHAGRLVNICASVLCVGESSVRMHFDLLQHYFLDLLYFFQPLKE